jgi:hypothetical protein
MSAVQKTVSAQVRAAAAEMLRRKRCHDSFQSYVLNVDIPLSPHPAMKPDETLTGPAHLLLPLHLAKITEVLQRTVTRPFGRCMIFAPPGSAKSAYTSVALPSWCMGRVRNSRYMILSYGSDLAERQSGRCQTIVQQENYREIFENPDGTAIGMGKETAKKGWSMTNGSELLAFGMNGGVTGNRCDGLIIDDPVAGRQEADSEAEQKNARQTYQDDALTRLKPGAWIAFIMTRWNENDLAGSILPDDYDGRSGMIKCKDGLEWEILNIPAKAEHLDDPLGRKIGDYLWPEWFPVKHWQIFENDPTPDGQRAWTSLYQQRPAPQGSGRFDRDSIQLYGADELPLNLTMVGASDHAVSEGRNDFTEIGMWGMDSMGHLWMVDWWNRQTGDTGEAIDEMLARVERYGALMWFNEGGVIDKAISGPFNKRSREMMAAGKHFCKDANGEPQLCYKRHAVYTDRRAIPSMQDKVAKCAAFIALCSTGMVHMPKNNPHTERIILQLLALPAGRYDDAADVCGLIGRAVDQFHPARPPETKKRVEGIRPFTQAWLEYQEPDPAKEMRYR